MVKLNRYVGIALIIALVINGISVGFSILDSDYAYAVTGMVIFLVTFIILTHSQEV